MKMLIIAFRMYWENKSTAEKVAFVLVIGVLMLSMTIAVVALFL